MPMRLLFMIHLLNSRYPTKRVVYTAIGSISFRIPKCSMETCYTIRPSPHLSYSLLPAISLLLASSSAAN